MMIRNWIELAILTVVLLGGITIKWITRQKCRQMDGFKGINNQGPGKGWKLK